MARIYVSSSWRNPYQPALVDELRKRGHQVYDFRCPAPGRNDRNLWDELCVDRNGISGKELSEALRKPEACKRFTEHFKAMSDADTCILLLPCGRSSHVEAGYMKGTGKRVIVFGSAFDILEPELMYRTFDSFCSTYEELFEVLEEPVPGYCRVCGCSMTNPCYNPEHGFCWWVDEERTLCSHCSRSGDGPEKDICDDPRTEHCVNDSGSAFKAQQVKGLSDGFPRGRRRKQEGHDRE